MMLRFSLLVYWEIIREHNNLFSMKISKSTFKLTGHNKQKFKGIQRNRLYKDPPRSRHPKTETE